MSEELREALNKAAVDAGLEEDDNADDQSSTETDSNKGTSGDGDGDDEDDEKGKSSNKGKASDDDKEDEDDDEIEDDDEELEKKQALSFYRKLRDPEAAEAFIRLVAEKSGYKLERLTQDERKAIRDEIDDIFKDDLGEDYALLAPGFTKALGKALDSKLSKLLPELNGIKSKLAQQEQLQHQNEVDSTLTWAGENFENFNDEKVQKKILKEMKEFPPAPGVDYKKYLSRICKLVGLQSKEEVNSARNSKIKNNKDGQKPSDGVRSGRSTKADMSLAEAAALAYEEQFKT